MAADDVKVVVTCDASELTAGMIEVRGQLEQTVVSVQRQEQSWQSFGSSVIGSIVRLAGPIIELVAAQKKIAAATIGMGAASAVATPPTLSLGAAVNFMLSPIVLTVAAIAALAGTIYYFSGAATEGSASTKKMARDAEDARSQLSALYQIYESFKIGLIGTEGLDNIAALGAAWSDLKSSLGELENALLKPLKDAGFEVGSITELFTGLNAKIRMVTDSIKVATSAIDFMTKQAKAGFAAATLIGVQLATGANADEAQAFIEIRDAERAAAVEAYNWKQAAAFASEEIDALMSNAADAAKQRGEVARISSAMSIEALDQEQKALEEYITQQKKSLAYDEEAQRNAEARAEAIANRRAEIESGKVKPQETPVDSMIQRMEQAVRELALGKNEAAISDAIMKGATTSQIEYIRYLQEEQDTLKSVEEARREAAKAAEEAARRQQQAHEQAAADLAATRDKYDLLTGSVSKYDIARREMNRKGYDENEISQLIEYQKMIDEIEGQKTKSRANNAKTAFAAMGSKEAYSAIISATQGDKTPEKETAKNTARIAQLMEKSQQQHQSGRNIGPTLEDLNQA